MRHHRLPPRKEIAKTSLGSEAHLAWSYAAGVLEVLPGLRAQGAMLVGLERTEASTPLAEALAGGALRRPLCLLMGNEVAGLSPEALDACDTVCHLPMRGLKTSLNVAVAFGVGAYRVAEALLPERPAPP
ncbi:MAG: hypothetical protein M5U26_26225 [Planctomycetota bacterium]|nr:hypothetical protein [Planctomycetota bacterium]